MPIRVVAGTLDAYGIDVHVSAEGDLLPGSLIAENGAHLEVEGKLGCADDGAGAVARSMSVHAGGSNAPRSVGMLRGWASGGETPTVTYDAPYRADVACTLALEPNGGGIDGRSGLWYLGFEGDVIELPRPARDGYAFEYWRGSVHYAGELYTLGDDHHLEAEWRSPDVANAVPPSLPGAHRTEGPVSPSLAQTGDLAPRGLAALMLVGLMLVAVGAVLHRRVA